MLVTRFENASQTPVSGHSFQEPSCGRSQLDVAVKVKEEAPIESIGPAMKRRKFCGVEYETHELVCVYLFNNQHTCSQLF